MSHSTQAAFGGAPIWRRFAALVYDCLLLAALSMVYAGLAVLVYVAATGNRGEAYTPMFDGPLFQLGWFAVIAAFYCYFWQHGGQTLGMRAWRLQLVSTDGSAASLHQCLVRCCTGPFALGLAGLGYWWALVEPGHHCLHDRLSQTVVRVLPKAAAQAV